MKLYEGGSGMVDLKLVHEYSKNLQVLYVEDNEALRDSTLKVLNNFFKAVDIAVDGLDGIDRYKTFQTQNEKPYDLIISDINMPHINGVEMSEKILELEPTQSIIFVTAHNEIEYLHKAIRLGISSFLLKPLKLQDLASVLYKVCQAISDRNLVNEHYAMIEDFNAQLENQNQALEEKNREQEKLIRLLNTMKVKAQNSAKKNQPIEPETTASNTEKEHSYYEQIEQLICEDLSELIELHEELDADIIAIIGGDLEPLSRITTNFSKYASILSMYSAFDALSATMMNFTKAMNKQPVPKDESKTEEIFMYLEAFMYILGKWQKELLEQSDEKVDQLDVSIIGDIETISNMWLAEKETSDSCEVEFF